MTINERVVKSWKGVDFADPVSRKKVFGALQHFMAKPQVPEVKAALQHFTQAGDMPTSVLEVLQKFNISASYDSAWESVFKMLDFTNSNRNGWRIIDVEDGLTFNTVLAGEKARIYKFAGHEASVNFSMYGGGLEWSRTLIDDREYFALEDSAMAFRNRFYDKRAETAYALIDAVTSGQNTSWQAVVPAALPNTDANYAAIRDMQTINSACQSIFTDCKDKGYGLTPNSQFVILAPTQLKSRVVRALGVANAALSQNIAGVSWNVTALYTGMLTSATSYYVIFPGAKIQWGDRMGLTVFDKFDETSYSDIAVGWGRFGGAIGDVKQVRRCATA